MAQSSPRLATILSFGNDDAGADRHTDEEYRKEKDDDDDDAGADRHTDEEYRGEQDDDAASVDSADSFEFASARPLAPGLVEADDLFAHGRILPAYPVFDHRILLEEDDSSTAPPSPDAYCAWAPRSAPGSPARAFPKSASTGEAAARRFRLRDLVGATNRSHSDGKEKFVFLQPPTTPRRSSALFAAAGQNRAKKPTPPPPAQQQRQGGGKKKGAVTEMDMATAHRLFYSKTGASGGERRQQASSYLPYRPAIVGFFATAHALGRSHHHPY